RSAAPRAIPEAPDATISSNCEGCAAACAGASRSRGCFRSARRSRGIEALQNLFTSQPVKLHGVFDIIFCDAFGQTRLACIFPFDALNQRLQTKFADAFGINISFYVL